MVTFFDHRELAALQGLPWRAQLVYIHGIKPYMDSKSGVVGLRRGISYQSISECLFVEAAQGRERYVKPSKKSLIVSIGQLVDAGLMCRLDVDDRLVFRCILALAHKSEGNLKGTFTAPLGHTNEGMADDSGGAACGGSSGRVYPQGVCVNEGIPLMSKSNKTYNPVAAAVSNLPRARVESPLVGVLAAACDDSGFLIFNPTAFNAARVRAMVDDWEQAGVSAKTVLQAISVTLARGVRMSCPTYLAGVVGDIVDEQSGAAESRRSALRVPRDDAMLERWARENNFSVAGRVESYADYRQRLSGELAEKMRGLN